MTQEQLWTDERIKQESDNAATHCDEADTQWVWQAVYVMSSATAEDLLTKMRDEYEAKLAALRQEVEELRQQLSGAESVIETQYDLMFGGDDE
jgi:urease accessory protein UreH